jgi:hypothetical protein
MKYRVEPIITEGCDCEDCKAGRHLYLLYRIATGAQREQALAEMETGHGSWCSRQIQVWPK